MFIMEANRIVYS